MAALQYVSQQLFGEIPDLWVTHNKVAEHFCPKDLAHFQKESYILESSLLFSFVLDICVLICVWLLTKEPHITVNKVIINIWIPYTVLASINTTGPASVAIGVQLAPV